MELSNMAKNYILVLILNFLLGSTASYVSPRMVLSAEPTDSFTALRQVAATVLNVTAPGKISMNFL